MTAYDPEAFQIDGVRSVTVLVSGGGEAGLVGREVTRKIDKARFVISGVDESANAYVLNQLDAFHAPVTISARDLRLEFSGAPEGEPADEVANGYDDASRGFLRQFRIFDRIQRAARRGLAAPAALSERERTAARKQAEAIFRDESARADFAIGVLPVHPEVARELDALIGGDDD
jgi:hypothetical protein